MADENPDANEMTLRRRFIHLRHGDLPEDQVEWLLNPARFWLELYKYHGRIQNELGQQLRIPHWEASTGELFFDGQVIRNVATKAHDVRAILGAFQSCGWKRVIPHPRTESVKPKSHILSLRNNHTFSLNEGIAPGTIRFGAGGADHLIKWELDSK